MKIDYSKIYKEAAKRGGWSDDRPDTETTWGDMYDIAAKKITSEMVVLDIGTAEGNHFLRIASCMQKGLGIDIEPSMIRVAKKNAFTRGIENIVFKVIDADKLILPSESFDVVLSRHCSVNMKEIYRILKPGGFFFAQMIHETDKRNLKRVFGRSQDWKVPVGTRLRKYSAGARTAGFKKVETKISNIPIVFPDEDSLRIYLKMTPTVPNFGDKKGDDVKLRKFITKYNGKLGIRSNTSRFLILALK